MEGNPDFPTLMDANLQVRQMNYLPKIPALAMGGLALLSMATATPAQAAGDLLVAPTRIVLDGKRGTQVILNNVGSEEATYRISLEIKRMTPEGKLEDVAEDATNAGEKAALGLIRYAPRRVTLPPNQPQSIRIGLNPVEGLADGEYRVHMLFRAIPKIRAVTEAAPDAKDVKIELVPLYGVTIPVIVRKGDLKVTAALANARLARDEDGAVLEIDASRSGQRSVHGEFRVSKPGQATPLVVQKGIAIYPEINGRKISLELSDAEAAAVRGDVVIGYYETPENGGGLISELRTTLR
jgi:P pilus assembly chaperone PapD